MSSEFEEVKGLAEDADAGNSDEIREENEINEALAILSQVTLSVLIVFILLAVVLQDSAVANLSAAKKIAITAGQTAKNAENTPEGRAIKGEEIALIEVQRQSLIVAIEKVENDVRDSLALKGPFFVKTNSGNYGFIMDELLLTGGKINSQFIRGCKYAEERLYSPEKVKAMREEWFSRVLVVAGMNIATDQLVSIKDSPKFITPENRVWLNNEIATRISNLEMLVRRMQNLASSTVYKYYMSNPGQITDANVKATLTRFVSASAEDNAATAQSIVDALSEYVKSLFEKQGANLIRD